MLRFVTLSAALVAFLSTVSCKKEFDPVQSFNANVEAFKAKYESKFPGHYVLTWTIDPNIIKGDSITKPWYGEGIDVRIDFKRIVDTNKYPRKLNKIVDDYFLISFGWFYSKNDNKWHLSKCDGGGNWIDATTKQEMNTHTIADEVVEELEGQP